jgi:hypothetical protein
MSPPLETNEKNSSSSTHSLGVDNDLSLLSSNNNNNNNSNNDQAMDIFLNQVVEYNNQHLSFEHQQTSSSSSHAQLGIDPNQLLNAHHQHDNKVKQEEQHGFAKPAEPTKKGKQKAKETGHSSLLHVSFELSILHVPF